MNSSPLSHLNADDSLGLRYAEFTVPLVKAVQELSQENQALKQQLSQQQAQLALLSSQMQELLARNGTQAEDNQ